MDSYFLLQIILKSYLLLFYLFNLVNATKDSIRDVPSEFADRHTTDETQEF